MGQKYGYLYRSLSPEYFEPENTAKMNCNETLFDVITSIEAYDFGGVSSTRTMNVHSKSVVERELGLSSSDKTDVPMKSKSCTYSEKSSIQIPGDSYEVTVSWEVQTVDSNSYKVLENMKEYPKHLIIRTYSGKGYFIRCEEEGYEFSYQEKDGVIGCEATFHNKNGIQRIL